MAHAETVKKISESFGGGDIPAILDQLADGILSSSGGMTIKDFRTKELD